MISFLKHNEPVLIWTGRAVLDGVLTVPHHAEGLIMIVGLGGTFHHERIRSFAVEFQRDGFATVIADVLTADEQQIDTRTGHFRVDTPFLASRVRDVVKWTEREPATRDLPIALFARAATAAACIASSGDLSLFAMVLDASRLEAVRDGLESLHTPTLLMFDRMPTPQQLRHVADAAAGSVVTIPGVSSLLDDELAAKVAAQEAAAWFRHYVPSLTAA
jgi:hypothetical protein